MLSHFPFSELLIWYKKNGRHNLPWRNYDYNKKTLGYRVWLAETMLQQTQVERVKIYFENILQAFPTIEELAQCSYEEFFPYYKGLGYYSRAQNMLKTSQKIVNDFRGIFPDETQDLQSLPGVGPYTAEAIRAFAYNINTLSFDTNLEKIFSRYYFGDKFRKLKKEEKIHILSDFQKSGISARDINNALMDYGATISLNNTSKILWEKYPLKTSKFYKTRGSLEMVKQKKKSSFPYKQAYVFAALHEKHKKYFFMEEDFSFFFIGKNTGNSRKMIQEYFLQRYSLDVSVRPPEVKSYTAQETPYLVCYTQIQNGKHAFKEFSGIKVRGFEEGIIEKLNFKGDYDKA